jgi:prepilin-type N-terminal cleavage/methylation domain-containing protein
MKKAFTLIELLVVIAIIAILAAILFPVFAQAKQAAKAIVALSNTKQMGTATLIYTNDYDDLFPLAGVLRPDGTGHMGMGVAYPYPYNDGEVPPTGNTIWQTPARQAMAQAWVGNAIQPYAKSYPLDAIQSNTTYTSRTFPGSPFAAPQLGSLTFNGDLHNYPTTSVTSPSIAIMWWAGNGQDNENGTLGTNPALNCADTVDDCQFNSGAPAGGTLAFAGYGGDVDLGDGNPNAVWSPFSNLKAPFVRTDSSAKSLPQGSELYPQYVSTAGAWSDPFVYTYTAAQGGGSSGYSFYYCSSATVVDTTGASTASDYTCYFRPDRTK